jgi:Fe2+ or Zn2+ uptake regulation protein
MKCVCGYEGEDFNTKKLLAVIVLENGEIRYMTTDDEPLKVFICPKCGTLKIEVKK